MGRGATFKEISKSIVEEIEIPLPPLEEQRRIAAVLDKVSDLIAKRRAQLDKLDLLVKSRFVEMFGDQEINTKGWYQSTVGELSLIHIFREKIPGNEPLKQAVNLPWNRRCGKCISKNTGAALLAVPMTV